MGELSSQMVTAANASDWERLEALEQRVSDHVALLKAQENTVRLEGEQRQRKVTLIKQMLDDDRQVRDLIQPWMAQLSKLINSTGTERRVHNAYGAV
ncbi:flagellar protein FliT [Massilia buxea]|nr:flagellar protein FliT [Pseudoduganella buxea]